MREKREQKTLADVKNRSEAIDWDRVLASYQALDSLPEDLMASEGEKERLLSVYNRALQQAGGGNSDVAMIALEKLTSSWPQFAEASSLFGVLLAKERRYREAEERFEKVLLASPDAGLAKAVDRLRLAAREERIRQEARDSRRRKEEKLLMPVRAHMAKSGILQRAGFEGGTGRMQMAGRREQEEVLRMEESLASQTRRTHSKLTRLIQGLTIAVIAASLLFLLFYFAVRPAILRGEDRRERLAWLERILEEQKEDQGVAEILDLYRKTFDPLDG